MKNPVLEISIYVSNGKRKPRIAIMNGAFGTRIYGAKFGDFDSTESFDIELNPKLVDELILELNGVKEKLLKVGDEK
jgi:hypothetical protein